MYRLLEPEEDKVLARFQNFYPTEFNEKVSSSRLMDKFYRRAILASGVIELIEKNEKPITVVDIAGGRGRIGNMLEKLLEERGISKNFNYIVVDLSRKELGKSDWKLKVRGDMSSVPVAHADTEFMLNSPNAIVGFYSHFSEKYCKKFEKGSSVEAFKEMAKTEEFRIMVLLGHLTALTDKLNILEATKLLEKDGVLTVGGFAKGRSAYPIDEMEGVPLKALLADEFMLSGNVMKHWEDYSGSKLEDQPFFVAAYTKTGEVGRELVEGCEGLFKSKFKELTGNKRFWETLEELEKIETEKKDAAGEMRKATKKIIKE